MLQADDFRLRSAGPFDFGSARGTLIVLKDVRLRGEGFVPFDDTVKLAASHGIAAVIHPGGSVRDADSIAACDALGLAMLVTGRRHFLH